MTYNDIKTLQSEIKTTLKQLDRSMKFLAELIAYDEDELNVNEQSINTIYEKVKKRLKRETTDINILIYYKKLISESEIFRKSRFYAQNYIPSSKLPTKTVRSLKSLSKELTEDLANNGYG